MPPRAKLLSSKVMFEGRVFGVRRDLVIEPGDIRATRDVVTHRGSVVVLPLFPNGDILLIRQYRHAVGRFLWELVAGRVEQGESLLASARRELLEETGYTARQFRKLVTAYPTPGFVSEVMHVYVAKDLQLGDAHPESDERIISRRFSLAQLERMMLRGSLCDSKSIAAILFFAHVFRRPR